MSIEDINFQRNQIPLNVLMELKSLKGKDIKIWRYMTFPKFMFLLNKSCLYLSNIRYFDDPFEGSFPKNYKTRTGKILKRFGLPDDANEVFFNKQQLQTKFTYINCWHMNDVESAAMWHIYSKSNESIAIQSTYRTLLEEIGNNAQIGHVCYIDFEKDYVPVGNTNYLYFFKRESFRYEQELRIIISDDKSQSEKIEQKKGILLNLNLQNLISNIFLSPKSPEYLFDLVQNILIRYNLSINVKKSDLDKEPFY